MRKTIITVATTGAWPKKKDNPNVPMTPAEIAEDVYACWKAGAAVAHLHMRDDEGNGTMSADKFRETVQLLRKCHPDCDIILNMTTSGDLNATDETRQAHLKELHPEMGSYDCGSMNWLHSSLFINHPKFLEELGKNMQEWGVKPEIEAFDPGMIANAAGISLAGTISNGIASISNAQTFPLFTFLSAALVNMAVPSAGGQWAVQAPVMFPAAQALGVSNALTTTAIAWGDSWTNLIQPFWALPVLGIAGLKVRDIMGYCVVAWLFTGVVIVASLLVWTFAFV